MQLLRKFMYLGYILVNLVTIFVFFKGGWLGGHAGRFHLRRFRPRLLRRIGLRRRGLASGIGGSPRSLSIQRAGSAGNGMISSILGQLEGGRTLESQNTSFHFISATNPCDARLQTQMQMNKNAGFRMQNLYSEPNVFVFGT